MKTYNNNQKKYSGADYNEALDYKRLSKQTERIFEYMKDGKWRTLNNIAEQTNSPESSASAQLRNFRKTSFGNHTVNRRRSNNGGLYEYQLIINKRS